METQNILFLLPEGIESENNTMKTIATKKKANHDEPNIICAHCASRGSYVCDGCGCQE